MPRASSPIGVAVIVVVGLAACRPAPARSVRAIAAASVPIAPPGATAPTAPPPAVPSESARRSYVAPMVVLDLAVVASFVVGASGPDDLAGPLVIAGTVGYVAGGAIIHHHHGNRAQVGKSVGRRLLWPVGGAALGLAVGRVLEGDCSGQEFCGLGTLLVGMVGLGVGAVVGAIVDWRHAHVDVAGLAPIVDARGDQLTVGVRGRL